MCVTRLNSNYFLEQDALLTSTGRSWNPLPSCTMKTDIRGENQSLPPHLSHIPEISGQNPQERPPSDRSLLLPHLAIKTKDVENNTITQSIILIVFSI